MDPVTLAASVVPFLVRYAQHLAGRAGDSVDEAISDTIQRLWKIVKEKFSGDDLASGALGRLEQQPANTNRQAAVEDHLAEKAGEDPDLSTVLAGLVRDAQSQIANVRVVDAGATAVGGDVTITAGGHAAGRDLTISALPMDEVTS